MRRNRILAAGTVLLSVLALAGPAGAATTPTPSDNWRALAEQALTAYEAAPLPASFRPATDGWALLAIGRLYGWDDPRVQPLITKLLAERNPDGGWGVGIAFPAKSGGGAMNPATTTYTVTIADHVGPALLAAYQAGVLTDREPLQTITNLIMTTGRINTAQGQCVAYSRSSLDVGTGLCVHNVNAEVARYLTSVNYTGGFGRSGLAKLVVDITRRETFAYNPAFSGWPYIENSPGAAQDPDHQAATGRALYALVYPVARETVYQMLTAPATNDDGRRAHMQLVSVPGGPGSQGQIDPSTTWWCEKGNAYLTEAAAYIVSAAGDAMREAQAATESAANALAC